MEVARVDFGVCDVVAVVDVAVWLVDVVVVAQRYHCVQPGCMIALLCWCCCWLFADVAAADVVWLLAVVSRCAAVVVDAVVCADIVAVVAAVAVA